MRESGFYWIRRMHPQFSEPEIAQWYDFTECWCRCGSDIDAADDEVEVLSERLKPPGE